MELSRDRHRLDRQNVSPVRAGIPAPVQQPALTPALTRMRSFRLRPEARSQPGSEPAMPEVAPGAVSRQLDSVARKGRKLSARRVFYCELQTADCKLALSGQRLSALR